MSQEVELGLRVPRQAESLEQFAPRLCGLPGWANYSSGQLWLALKEITRAVAANEEAGRNWELLDPIERGMARYVVLYDGDAPSKLMFMGYSFD